MKSLSTFFVCLLLFSTAYSQNNLFIPFGQSSEEVKVFLGSRDYIINIHEDPDMERVRAILDQDKQVEYVFQHGTLYAITVTRNYRNRKMGREILKNCLDYMDYVSHGNVTQTASDGIITHTAYNEKKVMKLFIQQHDASVTLTLTSMSRTYGPPLAEEDFYYEADLIEQNKRFISN